MGIVVVTGAGRGIGRTIAHAFASAGNRVFLCDRDGERLRDAVDHLSRMGLSGEPLEIDLARPAAPEEMIDRVIERAGRIDVLVNNARSGIRSPVLQESESSWEEGIAVTLKAAYFASQAAVRAMGRSGGGNIVNIASIAAFLTTHEGPIYHIAKAGIVQMTRYFAAVAGKMEVRVNCVCPGFIVQDEHRERFEAQDNEQYRAAGLHCLPVGRVGSAEDVAQAVLFLCSSKAGFVTGQVLVVDGGETILEQFSLLRSFQAKEAGDPAK